MKLPLANSSPWIKWPSAIAALTFAVLIVNSWDKLRSWAPVSPRRLETHSALQSQDLPSGVAKSIVREGFNAKPVVDVRNGVRRVYFVGNHLGSSGVYRVDPDAEDPKPELVVEGEKTNEFEAFHPFQSKLSISKDGSLAFVTKTS